MKWVPDVRRSADAGDVLAGIAGLGLVLPILSSLFTGTPIPGVSDIAFGSLPFIVVSFCVVSAASIMTCRVRPEVVAADALFVITAAGIVGIVLSLFITGKGEGAIVLSWGDALRSISTFGVFPLSGPPTPFGFFPALCAVGAGWAMRRRGVPIAKLFVGSVAAYVILAFFQHSLSWIAGILSLAASSAAIQPPSDAFRLLVNAQLDGYWTINQAERFFAPALRQAETSLIATRAAILYLAAFGAAAFLARRSVRAFPSLLKRLLTPEAGTFAAVILIGLSIGAVSRTSSASYTDAIAELVFIAAALAWLLWWQLGRDLDSLARDAGSATALPLASGAIATHAYEGFMRLALAISLFGGALLGWRVFAGLAAGAAVAWFLSRRGMGYSGAAPSHAMGISAAATCLAFAALAVTLRHLPPAPWMARAVISAALLAGIMRLFIDLRDSVESRVVLLLSILPLTVLAVSASRQQAFMALLIPFALGMLWVARKPSSWYRFGAYPLYGLLIGMALVALFLPRLFVPEG